MPAETSATALVAIAAFVAFLLILPFVLIAAAPFLLAKLALRRKPPTHRLGGQYAMR
ncbi:MAG TPA: hypothetical protein VI997_06335 [Candidatus Thermoplasmatota archaeon]|nr:hypothetical protein [Candidatus Thermoplasmatota archaeon]